MDLWPPAFHYLKQLLGSSSALTSFRDLFRHFTGQAPRSSYTARQLQATLTFPGPHARGEPLPRDQTLRLRLHSFPGKLTWSWIPVISSLVTFEHLQLRSGGSDRGSVWRSKGKHCGVPLYRSFHQKPPSTAEGCGRRWPFQPLVHIALSTARGACAIARPPFGDSARSPLRFHMPRRHNHPLRGATRWQTRLAASTFVLAGSHS